VRFLNAPNRKTSRRESSDAQGSDGIIDGRIITALFYYQERSRLQFRFDGFAIVTGELLVIQRLSGGAGQRNAKLIRDAPFMTG